MLGLMFQILNMHLINLHLRPIFKKQIMNIAAKRVAKEIQRSVPLVPIGTRTKYAVIRSRGQLSGRQAFEIPEIEHKLNKGWKLYGSPQTVWSPTDNEFVHCQAVVKSTGSVNI
jgi:hypothetical protein